MLHKVARNEEIIMYLFYGFQLSQTDELFHIDPMQNAALTNENEINNNMQESAQELLNHYVRIQGLNCSQV